MQEITKSAIEALGVEAPDDYVLKPRQHAERLKPEAAALKRILERESSYEIIDTYESADRQAGRAQKRYKRLAYSAAIFSFFAVLISSFLLLPWTRPEAGHLSSFSYTILVVVQIVSLVLTFLLSLFVGLFKPFESWMHARAEAESARFQLFNRVLSSDESVNEGELPLLPLKLEYFRRYQLDVQRLYYRKRGGDHKKAVKLMTALRTIALIIIVLAALPILNIFMDIEFIPSIPNDDIISQRIFLCIGLIGAALQGLLASISLVAQHERNATRYRDTLQNLEDLSDRPLEEAREAATIGDEKPVLGFVALVQEQISSEHREWVMLRRVVPELSLERLRELSLPRLR